MIQENEGKAVCLGPFLQAFKDSNTESCGNLAIDGANLMRRKLKELEVIARDLSKQIEETPMTLGNVGEVIAQSILGMRHIEDARMKYGKVIQYANPDSQESCYDK